MRKREVAAEELGAPSKHFPHAVSVGVYGRLLFISGMVAKDTDGRVVAVGDVKGQTRQVCDNIRSVVEAAGGTLEDVCRLDVYVRNIEHRDAIYEIRQEYFKPPLPSSTMVEVTKFVSPEYLVEITAIAVVSE